MTIDAVDFDGGARLAVDFPVAVIVLREVAVVAVHPFFEMNVGEMHGLGETLRIVERDLLAILVEPTPLAVVIKNGAEDPAMTVEISELRGLQLLVEFGAAGCFQKFFVVPETANCRALRIAFERSKTLSLGGVALLLWIHLVAINFVVPPGESEIRSDHVRAGMNVTDHALAGGNGSRENVLDGMAGLVLGNRRIGRGAEAGVAELCIGSRMGRLTIIRIYDMACRAAAAAIIAGMIIGPWERQDGIKQTRFL